MKITFLAEKDDTITVTEARVSPKWPEWVVKVVVRERHGDFSAVFSLHADAPPNVTCHTVEPGGQQLVVVEVPAEEPETEWVSECCGVGPVEGTDLSELSIFAPSGYRQGFCGGCHDHAEFEECQEPETDGALDSLRGT